MNGPAVRRLHRVLTTSGLSEVPDAELLERFVTRRDEAAFELLLRRHKRLVWGVCRRVVGDAHEAEDAFQATFLVFAHKASGIRRSACVAGWLFQVARRVATRARSRLRRQTVAPGEPAGEAAGSGAPPEPDLAPVLDEELARLRLPVVLCYLQGKTYDEAAVQLGLPKGTVSSRLTRARELLRARLGERGVTLSAAGLSAALAAEASAATPVGLAEQVFRAGLLTSAGAAAAVPAGVSVLAEGVVHAMAMSKLKLVAGAALLVGLAGTGGGVWVHQTLRAGPADEGEKVVPLTRTVAAADDPAAPPADDPERKRDLERLRAEFKAREAQLAQEILKARQEAVQTKEQLRRLEREKQREEHLGAGWRNKLENTVRQLDDQIFQKKQVLPDESPELKQLAQQRDAALKQLDELQAHIRDLEKKLDQQRLQLLRKA
ncbi:MAG TPA: sigma-70 family RNA polymerase sigma factor, partial [Gemmataceae bacterium]